MNPIINRRIDLTFKAAAIVLMAALFLRASYWAINHGMILAYFAVALTASILIFVFSPAKETDCAFEMAIGVFILLAMLGGVMTLPNCPCHAKQKAQTDCIKNEICTGPVNLSGGQG